MRRMTSWWQRCARNGLQEMEMHATGVLGAAQPFFLIHFGMLLLFAMGAIGNPHLGDELLGLCLAIAVEDGTRRNESWSGNLRRRANAIGRRRKRELVKQNGSTPRKCVNGSAMKGRWRSARSAPTSQCMAVGTGVG